MLTESMKSLNNSLTWKLETLGEDDPGLAGIYYQMGNVYLARSETDEAITCLEEYERLQRIKSQRSLLENAKICSTEGIIAKAKGLTDKALSCYQSALSIFESLFGNNHEKVASTQVCYQWSISSPTFLFRL